jgi:hypothetical protein
MRFLSTATPFVDLDPAMLEELAEQAESVTHIIEDRFLEWARLAIGKTVTWESVREPVEFAKLLLEVESHPELVSFEPLFRFWVHYPPHHLLDELADKALGQTEVLWVAFLRWWAMRTDMGNISVHDDDDIRGSLCFGRLLQTTSATPPPFSKNLSTFMAIRPFREPFGARAFSILCMCGIEPWFDPYNITVGGEDYDVSMVRYSRGFYQLWFSIAENAPTDDGIEKQELVKSILLEKLPEWPGVIEVIDEDREVLALVVKGWRSPVKELQRAFAQIGGVLADLTIDPEIENG